MDHASPFKDTNVPIIGQPAKLHGAVIIAHLSCNCEAAPHIQAIVGGVTPCPACKKKLAVTAKLELQVQQVAGETL
jgi:hypothetical protein